MRHRQPHRVRAAIRAALLRSLPALAAAALWPSPARGETPPPFVLLWNLGYANAAGIAVSPSSGEVNVVDGNGNRVVRYGSGGTFIASIGSGVLRTPSGLAVDPGGNFLVADNGNNMMRRYSVGGTLLASWPATDPKGVAMDSAGTVFVVSGDSVCRYNGSGALLSTWGGAGTGDGQFGGAEGIAVDRAGNVYVADAGNHRIQKFSAAGAYLTQWGGSGAGDGQFSSPRGVVVDRNGRVYVSDTGNHRIQVFTGTGAYLTQWGSLGTGPGQFNGPRAASLSASGLLYVLDAGNNRVQEFGAITSTGVTSFPNPSVRGQSVTFLATVSPAPSGGSVTFFDDAISLGTSTLSGGSATLNINSLAVGAHSITAQYPGDATHTGSGSPVLTHTVNRAGTSTSLTTSLNPSGDGQQVTFRATVTPVPPGGGVLTGSVTFLDGETPLGTVSLVGGLATLTVALGTGSHSVTASFGGNTDFNGSTSSPLLQSVLAQESAPAYVAQWGSIGSGARQFDHPLGVARAPSGDVYVVDRNNSRVQYFRDFGGSLAGQWGTAGGGAGQFNMPSGIASGGSGDIYVSDTGNHRIEKFTSAGGFVLQWGSFGSGLGQFSSPAGVAVGTNGLVYVVDSGNRRIQYFTSTGSFAGLWGAPGTGNGQFMSPTGIAVDPTTGNVLVADTGNQRIQKFNGGGGYLAQWGSAGSGNGQFSSPVGVAVDASGNVYVTDAGNHRVQKFNGNGAYLGQWGTEGGGDGQFRSPYGVVVNPAGTVLITDELNHRVQTFGLATSTALQSDANPSVFGQTVILTASVSPASATGAVTFHDGATPIATAGLAGGLATAPVSSLSAGTHALTAVYGGDPDHGASTSPAIVQVVDPATPSFALASDPAPSGAGQPVTLEVILGAALPGSGVPTGTVTFRDGAAALGSASLDAGAASLGVTLLVPGPHSITVSFPGDSNFTAGVSAALVHVVLDPDVAPDFVTQWGDHGSGNGQLSTPLDVATDAARNVYVADRANHRIQKFSPGGTFLARWGTPGMLGNGEFNLPSGVAVDGGGAVYVCDTGNHRIQKFTSTGIYLAQWGTQGGGDGQFQSPADVVVDATGNVYVCDTGNHRIQVFTPAGAYLAQWGTQGAGSGQLESPAALALDASGNVYVCDTGNHRIQQFSAAGSVLRQWGSSGTGDGRFASPGGVAVEPAGNVYVSDTGNHRIQKFTAGGAYLAQWGSPGSGAGQFDLPAGLAVDAVGSLVVADAGNHRIQRFRRPARIASVADIAQDQGHQVRVRFLADAADVAAATVPILRYDVFRRIDASPAAARSAPPSAASPAGRDPAGPAAVQVDGWDFVGTLSAYTDSAYNIVVPTLADSNASGRHASAFFVRAATATPSLYFDSRPDSGASVDNLPPAAPAPFAAVYSDGATHLHWGRSSEADFWHYRLYRGSAAGFVPGPENLIAAPADTGLTDPGAAGAYYKLSAVDVNGNESPYAVATPGGTTGVPNDGALRFGIERPSPNPARGRSLLIRFTLLDAAPARLELLDPVGRRIASHDVGAWGAGRHALELPADRRLAPGLYLVRLRQGARISTVRWLLLD